MHVSESVDASFASFCSDIRQEPVFVVLGVQGAGTNLLSRVLERAFRFSLIEDKSVIFKAAARLGAAPAPAEVRREYARIRSRLLPSALTRKTRPLIKANANYQDIDQHFDADRITSGADLARFVYAYGAFSLGTRLMAIKSDDIWEDIDRLDDVLPNRRVILLTRDFRDNLLSVAKKDFGPVEPLSAARYVKRRFAYYEAEYDRTPAECRYQLRYEDLLQSPIAVVRGLGAHFRLAPAPGGEAATQALQIRRGTVKKWSGVGPRQLACLEAVLSGELQRYGYELTCEDSEPPTRAEWVMATASDTLKRIRQKGQHLVKRLAK